MIFLRKIQCGILWFVVLRFTIVDESQKMDKTALKMSLCEICYIVTSSLVHLVTTQCTYKMNQKVFTVDICTIHLCYQSFLVFLSFLVAIEIVVGNFLTRIHSNSLEFIFRFTRTNGFPFEYRYKPV